MRFFLFLTGGGSPRVCLWFGNGWNGGTVAAPEASEKYGMGQKHGMCTERQVEMDPLLVDDGCFAYLLAQWVLSLPAISI